MNAPAETTALAVMPELHDCIRGFFDLPAIDIRPETTALDVRGWDSLAHVRLMIAIERRFAIRFSTREIARAANVGELAQLIAEKTGRPV